MLSPYSWCGEVPVLPMIEGNMSHGWLEHLTSEQRKKLRVVRSCIPHALLSSVLRSTRVLSGSTLPACRYATTSAKG